MTTFFKAVRPDGTDFHSGTVQWIPEGGIPEGGHVVAHHMDGERLIPEWAETYLSVATVPTNCAGMQWPCRLLEVEPAGREVRKGDMPHKCCSTRWRVVREVDAHLAMGPQGAEVAAIIDRAGRLTKDEVGRLAAKNPRQDAARGAATWCAAKNAARLAAWYAAKWYAAKNAARDAAMATLTRDLISTEDYDALTGPWRSVIGGE